METEVRLSQVGAFSLQSGVRDREISEFKVSQATQNSRPARATQLHPVSKREKKKKRFGLYSRILSCYRMDNIKLGE